MTRTEVRVVAGVGLSSAATSEEITRTIDTALARNGLDRGALAAIATRERFGSDPRLPSEVPVVTVTDTHLLAQAPLPADRPTRSGLAAQVSLGAAELVGGGQAMGATVRSDHVTVTLASLIGHPPPTGPWSGKADSGVSVRTATDRVPPPGPHGGDAIRVAASLGLDPSEVLDLSASLNPFAPPVGPLVSDLAVRSQAITAYPDPRPAEVALAAAIGVDPDRLVLTNGGSEAIALLAGHLGSGRVEEPEFSLYRRHLRSLSPDAPRWRSNPATPSGLLAESDAHSEVWDEAFYPLATGRWTRGDESSWRLGSLTKLWSCPGLRLGYLIAPDGASAEEIRARRPTWSVNGLALGVVEPMLERSDLVGWAAAVGELRRTLVASLTGLGHEVVDTEANWVLVRGEQLRPRLAPAGIVVRDCASFAMDGWVRVALPRLDEMDRVLGAFASVAPEQAP